MKVRLESQSHCAGNALCNSISDRLFPTDDYGYSTLQPTELEPVDHALAREAVAACPERALILEDDV